MVNGQPCMPHRAACFRHRENVKQFHIYITVCRNVKIQGALTTINPDPWQLLPMKVGPFRRQKFPMIRKWCSKSTEWSVPMWCARLDLRKVFDHIGYNALSDTLEEQGVPHAYLKHVQTWNSCGRGC